MVLEGVELLPSSSLAIWANVTEVTIANEVARILVNQVESIEVRVIPSSQLFQPAQAEASEAEASQVESRQGNTTASPGSLTIQFNVQYVIRSSVEGLEPKRYVESAFDSEADRLAFMKELQATGDENFENLSDVQVELDDTTIVVVSPDRDIPTEGGGGVSQGVLIGSIAAGVAGTALLAFVILGGRRRQESESHQGGQAGLDFFSVDSGVIRDIREDPTNRGGMDVEISTLGDPIPPGEAMNVNTRADMSVDDTANFSLPYDYKQEISGALGSVDGGVTKSARSAYSDVSSNIIEAQKGDMATLDEETLDYQYSPASSRDKPTHSY